MKKLAFLLLPLAALTACFSDPETARSVAEGQGYTQVHTTGHRWVGCGDHDTVSTGFTATVRNRVADVHCLTAPLTVAGGDTEDALFLSPIGAWQLCLDRDDPRAAMWVFAETKAIRPHAFEQSIHGAVQMMALLPDGDLPPRPHTRSGRVDEWSALKASSEHASYVAAQHSITRQLAHNQMRADAEQSNFKE